MRSRDIHFKGSALVEAVTYRDKLSQIPHLQVVDYLVEDLAKVCENKELFAEYQCEALKEALKAKYHTAATHLLDKDTAGNLLVSQDGILQLAIRSGCNSLHSSGCLRGLCETLIAHGAQINGGDELGNTSLYYTCVWGYARTFHAMVEVGAGYSTTHQRISSGDLRSSAPLAEDGNSETVNLLQIALDARLKSESGGPIPSIWEKPIQTGWGDIIVTLLDLGLAVNSKDPSLVKFFHVACYQGNINYAQKLLRHGVDLYAAVGRSDSRDYDMGTALHAAAFGGQLATTKLLLEHGADVHTKRNIKLFLQPLDCTAITAAATQDYSTLDSSHDKRLSVIEYLVEAGAEPGECKLALCAAADRGNVDMVRRLLRLGIRLDAMPNCNNVDVIELLLDAGLDLDSPPGRLADLQMTATSAGDVRLLEMLVQRGGFKLPYVQLGYLAFDSVRGHHLDMLEYLITGYGLDINTTFPGYPGSKTCVNLLQRACQEAKYDAVALLLQKGADVDCPGLPCPALGFLLEERKVYTTYSDIIPIVELLLDHGADANGLRRASKEAARQAAPKETEPPLYYAVRRRDMTLVELLLDRGAHVEPTYGSVSPLKLAQHSGFPEMAEVLSSKLTTEPTVPALSLGTASTRFRISLKSTLKG